MVSKSQIRFKGKAHADRESAAYVQYVSIYRRSATLQLGLRWGFETSSNHIVERINREVKILMTYALVLATGNRTVKVVPWFIWLSTWMSPPCFRMIPSDTKRPRPVPFPCDLVV